LLATARKALENVRPMFATAFEKYQARLAAMPNPVQKPKLTQAEKKRNEAWQEMENQVIEAELKAAICDFYLAQTFDEKSEERTAALKKAAKSFNAIFQGRRGTFYGLHAHFMEARCMHELGNLDEARAIYDEVIVRAPDVGGSTMAADDQPIHVQLTGVEHIFSEAEQYTLQIMKAKSPKEYFKEVSDWILPKYEPYYFKTNGYQGILFDFAKFCLELSEKATEPANKTKWQQAAITNLRRMRKIPSEYQAEAIKMLEKLGIGKGDAGEEELAAEAEKLMKAKNWAGAIEVLEKIQDGMKKAKKPDLKKIEPITNAIAGCYCNIALDCFRKGKLAEAKEALRGVLSNKEYRETQNGPVAAELLLTVVQNEYADSITDLEKAVWSYACPIPTKPRQPRLEAGGWQSVGATTETP
jgi:hypothetical protein